MGRCGKNPGTKIVETPIWLGFQHRLHFGELCAQINCNEFIYLRTGQIIQISFLAGRRQCLVSLHHKKYRKESPKCMRTGPNRRTDKQSNATGEISVKSASKNTSMMLQRTKNGLANFALCCNSSNREPSLSTDPEESLFPHVKSNNLARENDPKTATNVGKNKKYGRPDIRIYQNELRKKLVKSFGQARHEAKTGRIMMSPTITSGVTINHNGASLKLSGTSSVVFVSASVPLRNIVSSVIVVFVLFECERA